MKQILNVFFLVELGVDFSRDTFLRFSSLVVLTTVVLSGTSVFTTTASNSTGLLDVSGRNNLFRDMEPVSEVDKTLVSESVVVVLPRETGLSIALGGQRLKSLDNVKVLSVDFLMLGLVVILLSNKDTL